jgi:hypothetical protein
VSRPSDLPPADHYTCGTRARYTSGCRCDACRGANTAYEKERARARRRGDWNGLVDARPARQHILELSLAGVGRRTVADIARVAQSVIHEIGMGRKLTIRARTEKAILAVGADAMTDAKLVDARETWRRIARLLTEGFTKAEIARRLGRKVPALQLRKDQITARNAMQIEKLYRQVMT